MEKEGVMGEANAKSNWFQKLIVPGIVFQSCVIAGGYGTGRELVEYFMGYGPVKGTMAICLVTLVVWSLVAALTYMFAVLYQKYNYKNIMQELLGPVSIAYEIAYIYLIVIIMAVVTSAAGEIVNTLFGWNNWIGIIGMAVAIFLLVISGSDLIEKVLSAWSFILYGTYIIFLIMCFVNLHGMIGDAFAGPQPKDVGASWLQGGFMYAFYNMAVILGTVYTVKHNGKNYKSAGVAGIIAGFIGIIPGIILFIAMCAYYPQISDETLPIAYMLNQMDVPWFQYVFQIVLFGTLIETGSGLIYGITDRFETSYVEKGKEAPKNLTVILAIIFLVIGVVVAQFGLTGLIAKGYGAGAWLMFITYCIPMVTYGVYKIIKKKNELALEGPTDEAEA